MYASLCATVAYWSLVSAVPVEFQFSTSSSLDQDSDESPSGKPIMGEAGLSLITLSALFPILLIISCPLYGIVRRSYSQTGEHLLRKLDFISKGLDANADSRRPQERASADTFNLQSNSKLQVVSEQKPFAKAAPSATSLPLPERALLPNSECATGCAPPSMPYKKAIFTKVEGWASENTLVSTSPTVFTPPTASPRLPPGLIDDLEASATSSETPRSSPVVRV